MKEHLSRVDLLSYGVLALPLAFASTPIYIYAPDFYAKNSALTLAWLGVALLFLRLIDAIQDPLIGVLSDHFSKYRPYIIASAGCILVFSFYGLFHPLFASAHMNFILFIFLSTTAFSCVSINLQALGGIWGHSESQKIKIVGYREFFGLIGLMFAVSLPQFSESETVGWHVTSIALGVFMLLGLFFYFRWQRRHASLNEVEPSNILKLKIPKNVPSQIKKVYLVYGISMLASSIPGVLVVFYIRDLLDLDSYTGLFLSCYFLTAVASIPFWYKVNKYYTMEQVWLTGMLMSTFFFIWAFFLQEGAFVAYLIICIFSGFALGAEVVMPPAIVARIIETQSLKNQASFLFSILAFLGKCSLAVAAAFSLMVLDHFGFAPDKANSLAALHALGFLYAAIPCVLKWLSGFILWKSLQQLKSGN